MHCPVCRSEQNRVIETRQHGEIIRRRRQCQCGYRFTSDERLVVTRQRKPS